MSILTLGSTSDKKKEHKPKLLGPDTFRWGGGFPCEGVGAKKFGTSLETREIKLFWWDIPGFCRDILGCPKSLRKKFVFNFGPYYRAFFDFCCITRKNEMTFWD